MKKSFGAKTLVFPTPVFIVGSYDADGRPNMMTAAWAGVCCSKPPCIAVSLQKPRYSYDNIVRTQAFTINVPNTAQVREADYVGIYSGRNEDKFKVTGWTAVPSDLVEAPYVEECPLVLECKVTYTHVLGIHTQFVGEILDVKADEDVLDENGMPDVSKVRPLIFDAGKRGYYGIGEFVGQAFAIGKHD